MYVILVYDINLEDLKKGGRVLRNVHKICKRYLHHVQNSVFEGEIEYSKLTLLKNSLKYWLRDIDSCIIFKSRHQKWLDKEFIVEQEDKTANFI
ncbi:MAG: CRISPR-associated endonuclease Cas2 [Christensenellales bacterium]|jgi:CRISPR-associated protein Cas2